MAAFIQRNLQKILLESSSYYPVVTITGPRQSGKTTLARHAFPDKPYVSLENPDIRQLAQQDPRYFLQQYAQGAIIDEVQNVPELLSYIQGIVDEKKQMGQFILTGGQNFALNAAITQSLAGRTAILELLPLALNELPTQLSLDVDALMLAGAYPAVYANHLKPLQMFRNYVQTYLERDVRQLSNVHDLATFQKFMQLCAGRIGQLLNQHALAEELGVSSNTIKHWLNILEASYIIVRLQPFHHNLKKRLVKMPKLYFVDTGLANYLLGIENIEQLSRDPIRGHLFENLIVLEFIKSRLNHGLTPRCYFYRDHIGNEVDLIVQQGQNLYPIEIKVGKTFQTSMLKGLKHFANTGIIFEPSGYLIYTGEHEQRIENHQLINFRNIQSFNLMV
ncbi:MAG: ATP-binding protein [Gammaproteobacteria bacterium]|nr:ATP-binding protein [Gammaproteobacteria bacterium]